MNSDVATAAFAAQEQIKQTIGEMRASWLILAQQLYDFNESRSWGNLGYSSFEAWLADPEIDLRRRSAYYAIEVFRELVIKRGTLPAQLEGLEVSKVREILPAIRRDKVTVEDALQDVRVLGKRDLAIRYREIAGGTDNGHFSAEDEPEWRMCPTCGQPVRP